MIAVFTVAPEREKQDLGVRTCLILSLMPLCQGLWAEKEAEVLQFN